MLFLNQRIRSGAGALLITLFTCHRSEVHVQAVDRVPAVTLGASQHHDGSY